MAVSSIDTDTQSASGSEDTLSTQTATGVYVLVVDTSNMALGDIVVLRIKTKYASGGTSRLAFDATYADVQAQPIKYSPPIPVDTEIVCTLEQTDGTNRDYPWNLLAL